MCGSLPSSLLERQTLDGKENTTVRRAARVSCVVVLE